MNTGEMLGTTIVKDEDMEDKPPTNFIKGRMKKVFDEVEVWVCILMFRVMPHIAVVYSSYTLFFMATHTPNFRAVLPQPWKKNKGHFQRY